MRDRSDPIYRAVQTLHAAARRPMAQTLLLAAMCGILQGCRLLIGTTVVAVGAVGLVGYGVYKTGEAAVTGVGSVVSSGGDRASSVVYVGGDFKTTCPGTVDDVWRASATALKSNGFQLLSGDRDALSGHLQAAAQNGDGIVVHLDAAGPKQTAFRMRIGTDGDLRKSETLHQLIAEELTRQLDAKQRGNT